MPEEVVSNDTHRDSSASHVLLGSSKKQSILPNIKCTVEAALNEKWYCVVPVNYFGVFIPPRRVVLAILE